MKIAVNKCHGGFSVSKAVYAELGIEWDGYGFLENESFGIDSDNYLAYRVHHKLICAIENVGEELASGKMAEVRVIEIPDDVVWTIENYDGFESVHEAHRIW